MAPQSTITNGPAARAERSCRPRAASSLPVPDSPSMSTVLSLVAAASSSAKAWRMTGLRPKRSPKRS